METTQKTIQSVASEILNNMEQATRDDGSKYYRLINDVEWQRDIIMESHLDRMPSDDIYERIYFILSDFANADEDASREEIQDLIYEIEPDAYTFDLTKWLHDNVNNVYYLTEILEETDTKDGFQLLAMAQQKYIREIANTLLNNIEKYIEDNEV